MAKTKSKNIAKAIAEATEGKSGEALSTIISGSLELLKKEKMILHSDDVLEELQKIFDRRDGKVRTKIKSAKSLSKEDKTKIENDIKDRYKAKEVISEYMEDKKFLGGYRVEVEDEVLDMTYKNRLDKLEKFLIK